MVNAQAKSILVAEDNPALAAVIKFNLQQAGHKVTVASNGQEAWSFAQVGRFDFVVTDHQMPIMSGLELCEKLRSEQRYVDTPVLMLTAKALEMDFESIRQRLGISALLSKPFSPSEVVRLVSDCEG